ncbi:response regulator transcription factor [Shimazuella sp. AN120528]|uniref:response regulator transcription factor n=1 Tax=Shimazuella soli TaxID=1892854 RepID=UPI001F0F9EDB|nr:response regulator transcription factor [Shimazuella soli]MCH5586264.1 response regulator transcription factor [Shimazuella soli]
MKPILIVDDDSHIRELVKFHLHTEGYIVWEAANGREALAILKREKINLAIIDIMMPEVDGYELCKEVRKTYDIPIIMLTAKDQLLDKERGFVMGTDDYVVKPFEPKEILFRVKALLRRYQILNADSIVIGQITIDRKSYEVRYQGKTILLPYKEFEVLSQLASHPNRVFTRSELIQLIWGEEFLGDERTIDVHIKRLRERFSNKTHDFAIKTVRGVGYKLEVLAD